MQFGELDHVAIVVADLVQSERLYQQLGFGVLYRERIDEQGVDIVGMRAGDSSIELLQPLSKESPLHRYLGSQHSRLHHLAYRVADLRGELLRLQSVGVPMIDTQPRRGAHGKQIAFIHPSYTGGTLIELCQPLPDEAD